MSDKKIYIDGSGLVLGRLSSWIAQELMAGQQIIVVNSEKIIVSGRRRFLIEDRLQKRARATHTNPCLLYTSPSPRDRQKSRMPSSA